MPRTEAGRSLYYDADAYGGEVYYGSMPEWERVIAAIEAEAVASERERIKVILDRHDSGGGIARYGGDALMRDLRAALEDTDD